MSPRRPRAHLNSDLSVARLQEAFTLQGWTAEVLGKDYGEDLLVRIFDDGEATPYTFYVQVKSTETLSRYTRKGGGYVRYPISLDHLEHWLKFSDPVFLVIWDRETGGAVWDMIQETSLPVDTSGVKAKILVPMRNSLDGQGLERMRTQTVSRHRRLNREQRGSEILVDLLSESMNAEVSYDSQAGIMVIEHHDGNMEMRLFGATLELMHWMAKERDSTPEEVFRHVIRSAAETVLSIEAGTPYEYRNSDGSVTICHTAEEWASCIKAGEDYVGWVEEMPDD
ncbi:DUF4365 domain-containing protein [Streptomyces sp. NPDC002838]|uniref:DUF4365 domain-containing protein n=1 Tax=Streptomyces sp. NPDC002838 TaxID=3154436 RepID=UPI0033265270